MSFSFASRNIELKGTVLQVDCRNESGLWTRATLDLDGVLGNSDGKFNPNGSGFSASASNIWLEDGRFLHAQLESSDGKVDAIYNLDLAVINYNGALVFCKPHRSIRISGYCYTLEGSTLKGLLVGPDGKLHPSSIDLNEHLGNDDGKFVADSQGFWSTAENTHFDFSDGGVNLCADLKNNQGELQVAMFDLDTRITNTNGKFYFAKEDQYIDRDDQLAKYLEMWPISHAGGYIVDLELLVESTEHANRATELTTNSAIVTASITACFMFGGGPVGAAIGAAIARPIVVFAEGSVYGTVTHPLLQEQFRQAMLELCLTKTLRSSFGAGAEMYLVGVVEEELRQIESGAGGAPSEIDACLLLKRVLQNILDGTVLAEDEINSKFEKQQQELGNTVF